MKIMEPKNILFNLFSSFLLSVVVLYVVTKKIILLYPFLGVTFLGGLYTIIFFISKIIKKIL